MAPQDFPRFKLKGFHQMLNLPKVDISGHPRIFTSSAGPVADIWGENLSYHISYLSTGEGWGRFWMKLRNSSLWGIWLDLAFFLLLPKKGSNGIHLFFRLFSTFFPALSFKDKGKTERSVESDILSNKTCFFFVFSCFLLIRLKITWDFSWFWVWGGLGLFNFTLLLYRNGEETTAMWPKNRII